MGLLLIIFLAIAYIAFVIYLAIKVPWWAKPLIIIGAFLAVTTDGYLGRKKLEQLCKEQGGLHIYETVEGVEGVELTYSYPDEFMLKYGYLFIEGWGKRIVLQASGNILNEQYRKSKSRYQIKNLTDSRFEKYYYKFSKRILDKRNNKTIASYDVYGYKGGWVERFISSLYASSSPVSLCKKWTYDDFNFWKQGTITEILIPIK